MKDYLFIFRTENNALPGITPSEMTQKWMDWIGSIDAQNKLTDRGNRLASSGKVVKGNNIVTNGPYSEIKEAIGGYSIVKASSYEDAVGLAQGCPVFSLGGSVEVREISIL